MIACLICEMDYTLERKTSLICCILKITGTSLLMSDFASRILSGGFNDIMVNYLKHLSDPSN